MKAIPLLLILASGALSAETLRCTGVLGNSGEQGDSLVRFAEKPASGMGVVFDSQGSLWDRAGDGRLNRYAVDGRLLASYPLPSGSGANDKDTLVLLGNRLLMKIDKNLAVLPLDAPPDSSLSKLSTEATRLSPGSRDGWAAAANGKSVFIVNAQGETKPVAALDDEVSEIEIGPDDGIYTGRDRQLWRVDEFAPADQRGPWQSPGERPQWLDGHWFGSAWHGTLRRFGADFLPDPGVVLGGASGSFIGYVPGNHEMNDARGLASLGGNLFAASGSEGVLHLMEWNPVDQRFTILRRIGAIPVCNALALDGSDRVWFHSGFWAWSDGPDAPLRHSVPPPQAPGFAGAATLPGGSIVAPGIRWGKPALYYGKGDGPASLSEDIPLPGKAVACAALRIGDRQCLIICDAGGNGRLLFISAEGKYEGDGGPVKLPVSDLTSLASDGNGRLFAGATGPPVELVHESGHWTEKKNRVGWNLGKDNHFGSPIHVAASEGLLWISDTARHRVLCFDTENRKPLAQFGITDQAGSDLKALRSPLTVAARGKRAVVFDSGNQRLIRLELSEP